MEHDYDWLVIGSGFGGSVAALRLAEKGYRVAVLEAGRRFADHDFAQQTWDARRYYWAPQIGLKGIMRLTFFRDVFIVSGSGVGAAALAMPTPSTARGRLSTTTRNGRSWPTGAPSWSRSTSRPSTCWGSPITTATARPTSC